MSDLNDNINQTEASNTSVTEPQVNEILSDNNAEPVMNGAEIISGVEPVRKKGPAKILITIAVIIVLLIGAGISAYAFSPWVKNNVKMLINDPSEYYAWVESENMNGIAEKIAKGYDELSNSEVQDVSMELKADLETDSITSLIESEAGISLADAGIKIPSNVSFTESGDKSSACVKINADGKTLATMNAYVKDNKVYYQIPELSSSYICVDLNQIMELSLNESEIDSESFNNLVSDMATGDGLQELLTDKELEELLVKYFDIAFSNIDDVELDKSVKCEVGDVNVKYNKLTAEIDEGCLYNIAKDVLKEAKKDKTIIKLVETTGAVTKDEYVAAIDGLLEQLGDYNISGGEKLGTMNVYVDSKGVIQGRSFEVANNENVKLDYMLAEDGSDNAFEINCIFDNEGLNIKGDFEEKSNKTNGTVDVSLIGIKLDSDGKSQSISSEIVVDGVKYGTVSLNYSDKKTEDVAAFNDSEKVYNYTEDGADLQEYIGSADISGFLKNISDVIGIDLNSLLGIGGATDPFTDNPLAIDPATPVIPETTQPTVTQNNTATPETDTAVYDFSKIKFQVNGKDVTFPSKIDGILENVTVDVDKLAAGEFKYFYSDDSSTAVYIKNETTADAAPKDCVITGLSASDESAVKLTADGIGAGSNISDVVSKYGCKLSDPKSGYVSIDDNIDGFTSSLTFFYMDGVIYEVDVEFY
jgi:hypothetical protein